MQNFVSKVKNPYCKSECDKKNTGVYGDFIPKNSVGAKKIFNENNKNIIGRKVKFTHV